MASVKHQVAECVNLINRIGESKREDRKEGDTDGVYSIKYTREVVKTGVRFAEYTKQTFGIRHVFQLTSEHKQAYIQHLEEKGVTKGHIINVESQLKKLQVGVQALYDKALQNSAERGKKLKWERPAPFILERQQNAGKREEPENRSYTPEQIQQILKGVSPNVREVLELSVHLGLRVREVAQIRVKHILDTGNQMWMRIENGKGITKGGRFREIEVPSEFAPKLRSLIAGRGEEERIAKVKQNTIQSAVRRACDKLAIQSEGVHGFRHAYARRRLTELLGTRIEEGMGMIQQMITNIREKRKIIHGIENKELLAMVQSVVNQVHSELGHGEKRWKLMLVYMS